VAQNKDASLLTHYNEAVTKIKAVMQFSQKDRSELLAERVAIYNYPGQEATSDNLMNIQSAITHFRLLKIRYFSLQEVETERHIEPFALYSTQGNWILIAYCRLRQAFRAFRLDHIKQLTPLTETFEPHGFTLREYFEEASKEW
jgi:predicted DNA-binding transcriptional regulator YafY